MLPPPGPLKDSEETTEEKESPKKPETRKKERFWDPNIAAITFTVVLGYFIGMILISAFAPVEKTDIPKNVLTKRVAISTLTPTATAVVTQVPIAVNIKGNYRTGDLLKSYGTTDLCWQTVEVNPDMSEVPYALCSTFQLEFGDKVEITGDVTIIGKDAYWPIKVLQGSEYTQDEDWYLSDKVELVPTTLKEPRYIQDLAAGELVRLNYNFSIRNSPAGDYILGKLGRPLYFYGGQEVEILTLPEIGPDGHYWCYVTLNEIRNAAFGAKAYIPCEVQKIPAKNQQSPPSHFDQAGIIY